MHIDNKVKMLKFFKYFFISLISFIISFIMGFILGNIDFVYIPIGLCINFLCVFSSYGFLYTLCFIPLLILFWLKKLKIFISILISSYIGLMIGTFIRMMLISWM